MKKQTGIREREAGSFCQRVQPEQGMGTRRETCRKSAFYLAGAAALMLLLQEEARAQNALRVAIEQENGTNVLINWNAPDSATSQLQYSTNLVVPGWINLGEAARTNTAVDSVVNHTRFYRVVQATSAGLGPVEGVTWKVGNRTDETGMEFLPIAAGTFMMGSNRQSGESPVHQVTLTRPFWLAKTEVTQAQYENIIGENPSTVKRGGQYPVDNISWNDATNFCAKLTSLDQQSGNLPAGFVYALPTEAQWEYACRAGTTSEYAGVLNDLAWYGMVEVAAPKAVGTKEANAWGLHDMHGNVREWCNDWWSLLYYQSSPAVDPAGPPAVDPAGPGADERFSRVQRGGNIRSSASGCRSATRYSGAPAGGGLLRGFRPLLQRQ